MQNQTTQSFLTNFYQNYSNIFIAFSVGFCLIVGGILFHAGTKEDYSIYFIGAAILSPFLVTLLATKKNRSSAALVGLAMVFIINFATNTFWDYQDKPWFSGPETYTCDGPCYGWFSFENDSPKYWVLLSGFISLIIGIIAQRIRIAFLKK